VLPLSNHLTLPGAVIMPERSGAEATCAEANRALLAQSMETADSVRIAAETACVLRDKIRQTSSLRSLAASGIAFF